MAFTTKKCLPLAVAIFALSLFATIDAFVARTAAVQKRTQWTNASFSRSSIATPLSATVNPSLTNNFGDENSNKKEETIGMLPCGDALDKRLLKIAVPMVMTFMITPLMGAVDLFWVNRMGNPLAVAGQAASNQVYNTAFWLASFLPSGK